MNYSYSPGIQPTMLEAYLQRRALENVEPELGYMNDAEMIEQPLNSASKHVRMFRYTELPAIDTPLAEGVTPDPQSLTETAFSVMTKQYGGYMDYTDEIDLWHIDKKTQAMSDRLNRQAKLTIDNVGRDAICAGLNVMFPGDVTARASIGSSNIITYALIKKAVRNLKRKGAQPFADGFFHAKIDHDTYYDISQDSHWTAKGDNYDSGNLERYLLGTIYNVKFYAVDNGKVFKDQTYLYGAKQYLTAYADFDATNRIMTITDTMSEDEARAITGKLVYVKRDGSSSLDKATLMCIERVWPSGTANQTKILFRWVPDATETNNWTTAKHVSIYPTGGGNSVDVHATIIYGQKAFGCVTLGTKQKPNFRIIVKPLGSSGASDPLDQRGTIAWKVPFFAAAVLQDDFIVRIEHAVSA